MANDFVPVRGQCFSSQLDWVARARHVLTAHPNYCNTEHDGDAEGWRGPHFTALCFDQTGYRCRNGFDFELAEYPVWWVWPDQIAALLMPQEVEPMRDYKGFAHAIMEAWPTGGVDGGDLQEIAVEFGLLTGVPGGFDPEKHEDAECCAERGDPWFMRSYLDDAKERPDG